jgi:hypothetical protein
VNPRPLSSAFLLALVLVALPTLTPAQSGFRVTHQVVSTAPTHVEITGSVVNETRAEAVDVSVTVEAVGAGGKSAARGIAYVTSRLPAGATANFTAKVPKVSGVTGYRAAVTSFRFIQSVEGP